MRQTHTRKAGSQPRAECGRGAAFVSDRVAEDLTNFFLSAATVAACAALQPDLHVFVELADQELVDALLSSGVPEMTAMRVVVFAPVAFGRIQLRRLGLSAFPPNYEVRGTRSQTREPLRFADAPEFIAAQAFAGRADRNDPGVLALARRSAEVAVAIELGLPDDVQFTDPVINWDIL